MTRPDQTFRLPTVEERTWLDQQRAWVERHIKNVPSNWSKYRSATGKLGAIREILDHKDLGATDIYELQALGVVLGDALAIQLSLDWSMVDDNDGTSPCLMVPGTSIVLFPQTMISKRIERGEEVDVFDLANGIIGYVKDLKAEGV